MEIKLRSFDQIIQDMGAALRGSASALLDLSVGSVVRAILEANAGIALWMQWLILQVLANSRASTAVGDDLDTWMADFGLTRLGAVPAKGIVTVSRLSTTNSAVIPVGTRFKTSDGSITYAVTADPTLSTWQPHAAGYVVPPGVSGIDVPIECLSSGVAGNVTSSSISVIASPVPGIDQVRNGFGLGNGFDIEDDGALRERFRSYLGSLAKATFGSVSSAVSGVRQGLSFLIKENVTFDGTAKQGTFLVVVDDGEGTSSSDLLAAVAGAVDAARPIGTTFSVVTPRIETLDISVAVYTEQGYGLPSVASIQEQISFYIDALPIEGIASITRIAQCIYNGCPGVCNVADVSMNGMTADLTAGPLSVFKAGQIAVTLHAG